MDSETRRSTLREILANDGVDTLKDLLGYLTKTKEAKDLEMDFYKSLEVKSGIRAMFIKKGLDELKTSEEKKEFLKELVKNKILTTEVMKQIEQIMSQSSER